MTIENTHQVFEAQFYTRLEDECVRCDICGNECIIAPDKLGRCKSRENIDGKLYLTTFGNASSVAVDPIEKKPLYHFHPGTKVFSVGGWGCNFSCKYCQNWQISQPKSTNTMYVYNLSPEKSIQLALEHKSDGICWTYNEPAIYYEYTLETAKLAKEEGLYTAYITNGFMNELPLRKIAPYLDAYRVDFKGFSDEFYQKLCKIRNWKQIYDNTALAKELGMHVEVVTNIVPGYNDDDETLTNIATYTVENIGPQTPWHISRFFPNYELDSIPPTPMATIEKAYEIGKNAGLEFIYRGNCPGKSSTECPKCGTTVIERDLSTKMHLDKGGTCPECGYDLHIVTLS